MKYPKIEKSELLVYALIIIGILARLVPHPANFAPITALALFAGTYLSRKKALTITIIAMFISDLFLGFHSTMPYVYGSFIVIALVSKYLQSRVKPTNVIAMALSSSFLFFIVTNFGVWLQSGMYQHTLAGLIQCYTMAIPFYRNTLLGDIFYTGAFFGIYEFVKVYSFKTKEKIEII